MADGGEYLFACRDEHVLIRPLSVDDSPAYRQFLSALSAESNYRRFFSAHRPTSDKEIDAALSVDGTRDVVLGALYGETIVGVARSDVEAGNQSRAEVAFAVADDWQHHGLATELLAELTRRAQRLGVTALIADTLSDNVDMLAVFAEAGHPMVRQLRRGVWSIEIDIRAGSTEQTMSSESPNDPT